MDERRAIENADRAERVYRGSYPVWGTPFWKLLSVFSAYTGVPGGNADDARGCQGATEDSHPLR